MSRIARDGDGRPPRPDPLEPVRPAQPPEALPPGSAHSDYDDEVPSQRRLRWMTQVLVMPALVGGLWALAYGLGYCANTIRHGEADGGLDGFAVADVAVVALIVRAMLRGKIGARRRWMNVLLMAVLLPLGIALGWRAFER